MQIKFIFREDILSFYENMVHLTDIPAHNMIYRNKYHLSYTEHPSKYGNLHSSNV
jgi:hypothetical protein